MANVETAKSLAYCLSLSTCKFWNSHANIWIVKICLHLHSSSLMARRIIWSKRTITSNLLFRSCRLWRSFNEFFTQFFWRFSSLTDPDIKKKYLDAQLVSAFLLLLNFYFSQGFFFSSLNHFDHKIFSWIKAKRNVRQESERIFSCFNCT